MSNINNMVLEIIDIKGTIMGSLAATAGSGLGSSAAVRNIKDPKIKDKILKHPSRYLDYAPIIGGALVGQHLGSDAGLSGSRLGFTTGAGLGGLVGGYATTKLAKHFVMSKHKKG